MKLLNGEDGVESDGDGAQEATSRTKTTAKKKPAKGDPRIVVDCNEVETIVFGLRQDLEKTHGRKKNRAPRTIGDQEGDRKSVDMEDTDDSADIRDPPITQARRDGRVEAIRGFGAGKTRPPQIEDEVNFSVGGERGRAEKIEETPEALAKRLEGQRKAEERGMVRRAARRGCAFGFLFQGFDRTGDDTGPKNKSKKSRGAQAGCVSNEDSPQTERRKCEALMSGSVVEPSFAKGDWSIRWRE